MPFGCSARSARLAQLAAKAEGAVVLPAGKRFETLRRGIRQAIAHTETGRAIEDEVTALLR